MQHQGPQLSLEDLQLLSSLKHFPRRIREIMKQVSVSSRSEDLKCLGDNECVKAARMLLHYAMSAVKPQTTARMQKLADVLRGYNPDTNTCDCESLVAMAARLSNGKVPLASSASASTSHETNGHAQHMKEAVALLDVTDGRSDNPSNPFEIAANKLSKIAEGLRLKALDTPFITDQIMATLDENSEMIQKHWQRDFSPLKAYAPAHASMCVHPRFLRQTMLLERVAAMSTGALADPDTRLRMGKQKGMEQVHK